MSKIPFKLPRGQWVNRLTNEMRISPHRLMAKLWYLQCITLSHQNCGTNIMGQAQHVSDFGTWNLISTAMSILSYFQQRRFHIHNGLMILTLARPQYNTAGLLSTKQEYHSRSFFHSVGLLFDTWIYADCWRETIMGPSSFFYTENPH